jgi:hypothetical protein
VARHQAEQIEYLKTVNSSFAIRDPLPGYC